MKKLDLSIIVPIYNSEKYLNKCLKSLQNQLYTDFEVLLINDGSTDNSKSISKKFETMDSRFIYYEIENQGVSSARNFGLSKIKGKYVTFLDADDFLDENHLLMLMENIAQYDMVISGHKVVEGNKVIETRVVNNTEQLTRHSLIHFILQDSSVFSYPWNKIYRSDLIEENEIKFKTDIHFGEDLVFNIEYSLLIDTAMVMPIATYNYVQNDNSASANLTEQKLIKRITDVQAMIKTIELLQPNYKNEVDFLKKRISREGIYYYYKLAKFHVSKNEILKFESTISPFTTWRIFKSERDLSWLKFIVKYFYYKYFGKLILLVNK